MPFMGPDLEINSILFYSILYKTYLNIFEQAYRTHKKCYMISYLSIFHYTMAEGIQIAVCFERVGNAYMSFKS